MIISIDLSQEILATDMSKPVEHRRKRVLRSSQLYGHWALKLIFPDEAIMYNLFTRRRASKASNRSPKTTFLDYFHVFAGNHQWAYH